MNPILTQPELIQSIKRNIEKKIEQAQHFHGHNPELIAALKVILLLEKDPQTPSSQPAHYKASL